MPKPPAELLVDVPEPNNPQLATAIAIALAGLPSSDAYQVAARHIRIGRDLSPAQLLWPSRLVARSVNTLRPALRADGARWPSVPGGPDCPDIADVPKLGDALLVTGRAQWVVGDPMGDMEVCLDGLRLCAHLQMIAGPDGELAVQRMDEGFLVELGRLLTERALPSNEVRQLLAHLEQYRRAVRPLDTVLKEGLSIAYRVATELKHEEWAGTVRLLWHREPHRDPAESVREVWQEWELLIKASALYPDQADTLLRDLPSFRDEIGYLFEPPPSRIIRRRATRVRALEELRLQTALELWRMEHGAYPQRLSQLVPRLLPSLPSDPMSGASFFYVRREDSYLLRPGTGSNSR